MFYNALLPHITFYVPVMNKFLLKHIQSRQSRKLCLESILFHTANGYNDIIFCFLVTVVREQKSFVNIKTYMPFLPFLSNMMKLYKKMHKNHVS